MLVNLWDTLCFLCSILDLKQEFETRKTQIIKNFIKKTKPNLKTDSQ